MREKNSKDLYPEETVNSISVPWKEY